MTTLRPLFAWVLLAYVAAELLFISMTWWLPGSGNDLFQRSYRIDTTTVTSVGLPLLAVLISAQVKPVLEIAKTVAMVALVEYLIILLFGGLTFTLGLMHMFDFVDDSQSGIAALSYVVFTLLGFTLAALAAWASWRYHHAADTPV